jgi:ribonuclease HI
MGSAGAKIVAILTLPSGIKLRYTARLKFQCTNNSAEYKAIILALSKLRTLSARQAVIKTYSQVISDHIKKTSKPENLSCKNTCTQSAKSRVSSWESQSNQSLYHKIARPMN